MAEDKTQSVVTIRVLGHDYAVSCPASERDILQQSAQHLARRVDAMQHQSKTISSERIAVMVGLNIARDLLKLQQTLADNEVEQTRQDDDTAARLQQLQHNIDQVLASSS